MKILVTGGFGFIGRHLVEILKSNGFDVTPFGDTKTNLIQVTPGSFFSNFDVIFHLAAIPRVGVSLEHPGLVLQNNQSSTLSLLEHCRLNPKTLLINASSSSVVYADLDKNPYALSKKVCEDMVNTYVSCFGIKAASVRFFNVYGPGESDYGKNTTLVQACKNAILENKELIVNGDGSVLRDYTHVLDVVSGLLRVLLEMRRGDHKPVYEIGAGEPVSVKKIVETFKRGTNLRVKYGPPRTGDAPITRVEKNLLPVGWYQTIKILDHIKDWKAINCPKG
jgi:UDP-glucose 4-epimerase